MACNPLLDRPRVPARRAVVVHWLPVSVASRQQRRRGDKATTTTMAMRRQQQWRWGFHDKATTLLTRQTHDPPLYPSLPVPICAGYPYPRPRVRVEADRHTGDPCRSLGIWEHRKCPGHCSKINKQCCEAAGQRICITQEYGISGIGRDWPSYLSQTGVLALLWKRQSRVGGGLAFIIPTVLTMYEKSGVKNAKHLWTSSTTSIGALSYLGVWCYQHIRQCQFRTMECMATRTMRFARLPSLPFLCIAPPSMVRRGRVQKSTHVVSISGAGPQPGTMSTYEGPNWADSGQPPRAKIGQNPYPTLFGIIGGPVQDRGSIAHYSLFVWMIGRTGVENKCSD
ncbi:hypothetical protein EDB83DRAFT_2321379 [Lactarius deliciosus]|nr:hypothetical protein EDB83DRAFT_2321670 [Lactarius deliciosus]KAH9015152.1 hypothetical protein EDB83DRAFT_2321379 [Lactarius deliciosus]